MAYDRSDHVATIRDRQQERAREIMPLVRLVASAATVMHGLTENEHWNRYLTYLQGIIETWVKARDSAAVKLGSPAVWSHEELLKLKCEVLVANATIDAFRLAINLPKAIMAGKSEAERIIGEFERTMEKKIENPGTPES